MHRGFTLIELLVVIAILAILAAIAIPNLLEAQTRSKVSRTIAELRTLETGAAAFRVDNNRLFPDANDSNSPPDLGGLTFETENPGTTPDLEFLDPSLSIFYTWRAWRPLTTPVAYLSNVPTDSFSKVVPYGYDTREVDKRLSYAVALSAGPDRVAGHWNRAHTGSAMAVTYDPTNGTTSAGDIWRAFLINDTTLFRTEYGAHGNLNP